MHNGSTETAGIDPGSNRLQQTSGAQIRNYSYDAAGNLIGDGTFSYGYNAKGRRISATATGQTVSYGYNALGQRISKTVNGVTTRYVYDEQGHLVGEYDGSGQLIQEIVWLGDLPIAALRPGATTPDIYYIHADHLGTPRQITRPSDNKVLWAWESEPFGVSLPNQNPSGLGSFVFNLRFPGQYYDQETGLFYNYFRDYDPATGRYVESDPIGLKGGINTYGYVGGNPVNLIDPLGLLPCLGCHSNVIDWYNPDPNQSVPMTPSNNPYYSPPPKMLMTQMDLKHQESQVKQKDFVIRKVEKIGFRIRIHEMAALVMAGKMIKVAFGAQRAKAEERTAALIGTYRNQVVGMTMYFLLDLEANWRIW